MGFDEVSKAMKLLSLHPGVSLDQVRENTGFALLMSDQLAETPPPSQEELDILRTEVDPLRYIIGR